MLLLKGHYLLDRLCAYILRLLIQLFGHNIYNNTYLRHFYFGVGSGYTTIRVRDRECE
jgi:hypothetical protein